MIIPCKEKPDWSKVLQVIENSGIVFLYSLYLNTDPTYVYISMDMLSVQKTIDNVTLSSLNRPDLLEWDSREIYEAPQLGLLRKV